MAERRAYVSEYEENVIKNVLKEAFEKYPPTEGDYEFIKFVETELKKCLGAEIDWDRSYSRSNYSFKLHLSDGRVIEVDNVLNKISCVDIIRKFRYKNLAIDIHPNYAYVLIFKQLPYNDIDMEIHIDNALSNPELIVETIKEVYEKGMLYRVWNYHYDSPYDFHITVKELINTGGLFNKSVAENKYPDYLKEYQKVSLHDIEWLPYDDRPYFCEARIHDKTLHIVYHLNGHYYVKRYRIHLLVENANVEELENIAYIARRNLKGSIPFFRVVHFDNNKYAIVSPNFDSDVDAYCQSLYENRGGDRQ